MTFQDEGILMEAVTQGGPKLFAALAKAQAMIEGAAKGKENPHFRSKYADLASVWDACRDALTKNGLSVIQRPHETDGSTVKIETMLCHESGEWISGFLVMKPTKGDPQGIGSALTYCRRYALASMVGVAPEDDDGNAASRPVQTISDKQAAEIKEGLAETESDTKAFLAHMAKAAGMNSIATVEEIPASMYGIAARAIAKKKAA